MLPVSTWSQVMVKPLPAETLGMPLAESTGTQPLEVVLAVQ